MTTFPTLHRTARLLAATAAVGLLAIGCGDDGADDPGTAAPITTPDSTPGEIEVVATDFAFDDLPAEITAGTRLTLRNDAASELHELVAFALPDDETRPAAELMALPPDELGAILGAAPPELVVLAAPGGEPVTAVGDGTLDEPGRYLVICAIPTGVDPDEYIAAAAESGDEPPEIPGGPPHLVHGMWAEVSVVES
ncbi:MAG TPA: hypothetical protein VK866_00445 [Acidimicrobiales bacterium]|nr:hypothetical protein [Acidimicrobiales bacterium]